MLDKVYNVTVFWFCWADYPFLHPVLLFVILLNDLFYSSFLKKYYKKQQPLATTDYTNCDSLIQKMKDSSPNHGEIVDADLKAFSK